MINFGEFQANAPTAVCVLLASGKNCPSKANSNLLSFKIAANVTAVKAGKPALVRIAFTSLNGVAPTAVEFLWFASALVKYISDKRITGTSPKRSKCFKV